MPDPAELSPEDAKLVTLARGARGRSGAAEGAAVRDETGRTYSGAAVSLASFEISALQLAVAQAVSAGSNGLEAAVVTRRDGTLDPSDLAAVRDLGGPGVVVYLVSFDSTVLSTITT
ncbi:MAG: cytidine deaminase [Actinobacteria bacterium]|nr:cytidine deaminase [Actinomycetota bacterium]MSW35884.1 cytidine deaminase [Actinomycetota bacterium]MSX37824.1 cytidine deaminase [Actinomycetota bacterium]